MLSKSSTFILCVIFLSFLNLFGQQLFAYGLSFEEEKEQIDNLVQNVSKCFQIPGVSVSLVRLNESGEIVEHFAKGYGRTDPEGTTDELVLNTTRFCVGSITKQFTSALVINQLANKGFTIRYPLVNIIGKNGAFFNDSHLDRLSTAQDLLAHRMGLPNYDFALVTGLTGKRDDIWKNLHLMGDNSSGTLSKYRNSFLFNDWMYNLAGYITELVDPDGSKWEAQMDKCYFKSLNMTNACFLHGSHKWHDFALPCYRSGNESDFQISSVPKLFMQYNANYFAPSDSLCVSAEDMIKYMTFILSPTESDNFSLKNSVLQTIFETSNVLVEKGAQQTLPLFKRVFSTKNYALGWRSGLYRNYAQYSHEGNLFGYNSHLIIFPQLFLGIYVSTTSGPAKINYAKEISLAIFDIVTNQTDNPLTADEICQLESPEIFPNYSKIEPYPECNLTFGFEDILKQLTGIYIHPIFGNLKVELTNVYQLQFAFGVFGKGLLCPINKNFPLTNKFRLYFYPTPNNLMWFYDSSSSTFWNSSYIIFRKNLAGLSVLAEFPLLEPSASFTTKILLTRQNYSSCDPNPCLRGGTCNPNGNLNFRCICPPLVSGSFCEIAPHRDCTDYLNYAVEPMTSGLYNITLSNNNTIEVFCDMKTDGGGWTVIQRRVDNTVSFNRNYTDFQDGFGDPRFNYWIGLSQMNLLSPSSNSNYTLRIDLMDCDNNSVYESYNNFWIDNEANGFTFNVKQSTSSGTAGDALSVYNPLMNHNGKPFIAIDHDNEDPYKCVKTYSSGWWFSSCYVANLNGIYHNNCVYQGVRNGIEWLPWKGYQYSLKYARMSIKRMT